MRAKQVTKSRYLMAALIFAHTGFQSQLLQAHDQETSEILLGVYAGKRNEGLMMKDVQCLEAWLGKKHAVVNVFTSLDSVMIQKLFSSQLPQIWSNKNIPLISWEIRYWFQPTPEDIEVRIANGQYNDSVFIPWVNALKRFLSGPDVEFGTEDDRRVYLRFAPDMNGNWFPYSAAQGNNDPSDYIRMWQQVRNLFQINGIGSDHIQWIWSVNHIDIGGYSAESYFPGHDNIDWVGVGGFNWGKVPPGTEWVSADEIYGSGSYGMITRVRQLTLKPLAITFFASGSCRTRNDFTNRCVPDVLAKSKWITDAFQYFQYRNVGMTVWFNEDKETDWEIFGGPQGDETFPCGLNTHSVYTAYKTAVSRDRFLTSDPTNPRLLTDDQFRGSW